MLDVLLGLLAFLVLHLGPLYGGYRICSRVFAGSPLAVVATGTFLCWAAFLTASFRLFGSLGIAGLPTMLPAAALFGVLSHVLIRRVDMANDRRRFLTFWRRTLRATWPLWLIVGAFALCALARGLALPPLAWDSLTYHLVLAGHFVQTGGLEPFFAPGGMDGYSHFPENGEILAACFLLPFSSDTLLGLYGWPFLVMLGTSLFGTARLLRLPTSQAWLLALLVAFSPMCFAYINSTYVDLPAAAEVLAGVLFCMRFRADKRAADAVLAAIAFGVAVGTKSSALPIAGIAGLCVLAVEFVRWQRGRARPRWLLLAVCLLVGLGLGAPKYVQNAIETGNPFYPIGLRILGKQLPHSQYVQRVLDEKRQENATLFGDALYHDLAVNLWPNLHFTANVGQVRTAGPAFLVLMVLAIVYLLTLFRRGPPRTPHVLLASFFLAPLLLFYIDSSDSMKLVRRFWVFDCSRFLTAPFALMGLAGLLALPRRGRFLRPLVRWILVAFLLWGLLQARIEMPKRLLCLTLAAGGLVIVAGLCASTLKLRGRRLVAAAIAGLVLLGAWTVWLQKVRDDNRYDFYRAGEDLHPFPRGNLPLGWSSLDDPARPKTIAYTVGWRYHGHNWILYPLMGGRLQNRVVYASVNRRGRYSTALDLGLLRETFDKSIWLQNLQELDVEYLFVQIPEPKELEWLRADKQRFQRVQQGQDYFVFTRLRR